MRKLWLGTVLVAIAICAIAAGFLSVPANNIQAAAFQTSNNKTYFGDNNEFLYNKPIGDGAVQLGKNKTNPQMFELQTRYYNAGTEITGDATRPRRPVFSSNEMNTILDGQTVDYGFVMLDNANGKDNKVVLELTNLNALTVTGCQVQYNRGTWQNVISWNTNTLDYAVANPGRLFYNNSDFSIYGAFDQQGYYEFRFNVTSMGPFTTQQMVFSFKFYIVKATDYSELPVLWQNNTLMTAESNGSFYFNYGGDYPFMQYNESRFAITVTANNFQMQSDTAPAAVPIPGTDLVQRTFEKIGSYKITARIQYKDGTNVISPTKYKDDKMDENSVFWEYSYRLYIFGAQAYYEKYDAPANTESRRWFETADVTAHLTGAQKTAITDANVTTVLNAAQTISAAVKGNSALQLQGGGRYPATTNTPPISICSNVLLAPASCRVLYNDGYEGWKSLKYVADGIYTEAGEYMVILSYEYPISSVTKTFSQIFYFRINDFVEVRVQNATTLKVWNLTDYNRELFVGGGSSFFVYVNERGANKALGPYETAATIQVRAFSFNGVGIDMGAGAGQWKTFLPAGGQINFPALSANGRYEFRVFYGVNQAIDKTAEDRRVSNSDFSIIIDNEPIKKIIVESISDATKIEGPNSSANFAMFGLGADGRGDIEISWDAKASGIGFTYADIDFYSFDAVSNNVEKLTLAQMQTLTGLKSSFAMKSTEMTINPEILNIKDERGILIGHKIDHVFTRSGLYVISITDNAFNNNIYFLIIDGTTAAFAQSDKSLNSNINTVTKIPTYVGFGTHKVIQANKTHLTGLLGTALYNQLEQLKLLNDDGIVVPIATKERSIDNVVFDFNISGRYDTITTPNMFYYKVTDVLGNESRHYIFVNQDICQGTIIEDDAPNLSTGGIGDTASIVRTDGISNRKFVTFSFQPKRENVSAADDFVVQSIEVVFYELNYQKYDPVTGVQNTNYPFSYNPTTMTTPYNVASPAAVTAAQTQYIQIGRIPETRAGLYVITRRYFAQTVTENPNDTVRNYFFIADRNPIISKTGFQSEIAITFGADENGNEKTAGYNQFEKENNEHLDPKANYVFQTDSSAVIRFPSLRDAQPRPVLPTKYGYMEYSYNTNGTINWANSKYFGDYDLKNIRYVNANGAVIYGNKPMESLKLNVELERISQSGSVESLGFKTAKDYTNGAFTVGSGTYGGGVYRLALTDGSGGLRLRSYGTGMQVVESNRSEILFEILRTGPVGAFYLNGKRLSAEQTSVKINRDTDELSFSYTNDSSTYLAPIDESSSRSTWRRYVGSVRQTAFSTAADNGSTADFTKIAVTPAVNGTRQMYTWVLNNPLSGGRKVRDSETYSISLSTRVSSAEPKAKTYAITIDNTTPNYNLNRIKQTDQLYKTLLEADKTNTYVFAVEDNFAFQPRSGNTLSSDIPYNGIAHDTSRITYFAVDNELVPISGEMSLSYGITPFVQKIPPLGLTETRFYRIVERDEAGNESSYYIQLRGRNYHAPIKVKGLADSPLDGDLIANRFSSGISVTVADVSEYWRDNPYFQWMYSGSKIFQRAGNKVYINGTAYTDKLMQRFEQYIQSMLDFGVNKTITLEINDRFFDTATNPHSVTISQVNAQSSRVNLVAEARGNDVLIRISNYNEFITAFPAISFRLQVFRITPDGQMPYFQGQANEIGMVGSEYKLLNGAQGEFVIIVRDSFNRTVTIEYHGEFPASYSFTYNGNTQILDGMRYAGDNNGVNITYNDAVYNLQVLREDVQVTPGFGAQILLGLDDKTGYPSIQILPDLTKSEDFTKWSVRLTYKSSGLIVLDEVFMFYHKLPQPIFKNINGDLLDEKIKKGEINGIVEVSYSNLDAGGKPFLFGSTIKYTRTYSNPNAPEQMLTDRKTIGLYETKFRLDLPGIYRITIINEVWASREYVFEITDIDNTTYKVMFNGQVLAPSPKQYHYEGQYAGQNLNLNMASYFILSAGNSESAITEAFSKVDIMPSINYPRDLDKTTPFIEFGNNKNIRVYKLVSSITGSAIYFAVTAIQERPNIAYSPFSITNAFESDIYYSIFSAVNTDGLGIHTSNNLGEYYGSPENVIYVEYYHNREAVGEPTGRFLASETLYIYPKDYGIFTFHIYDWAGNRLMISGTDGKVYNYYTLAVLSRAPILINNQTIVNGMVYNELRISVMDVPHTRFTNSMFVSSLSVECNGKSVYEFKESNKHEKRLFDEFNQAGVYRIMCQYVLNGTVLTTSDYTVQLIPIGEIQETFYMHGASNLEIVGIKRSGIDVRRNFPSYMTSLTLNSSNPAGLYTVTVRVAADNIRAAYTMDFVIILGSYSDVRVIEDYGLFGKSTQKRVTLTFDPRSILTVYGNATLKVERDGQVLDQQEINALSISESRALNYSKAGVYEVSIISNSSGERLFSDGFQIKTGLNALSIVFIILGVGIAVVMIAVFIQLRTRVKVR